MGDIFKILESQPYLVGHVTLTEERLKHKRCKDVVIKNDANI